MKRLFATLALLSAFIPSVCLANIVYQWQVQNDLPPQYIQLRLDFAQEVYDQGSFSFHQAPRGPILPDSGLISFFYTFPANLSPMDYYPRLQPFRFGLGALDMEVKFEANGLLSGWIRANDQHSSFEMRSRRELWEVIAAESDQSMPNCGWTTNVKCQGALGKMVLTDIPEPGSIALIAAGFAVFGIRRRSK
ncbi:PEP-CTERM sorting domain-containing protein [Massilia sp. IC2-477]|uniref:PEP-CTERM sorting domain-containing protein n=1 Tax=Massilia sp. IC2-477 TaxID=2887198 RepID=UPI001D105198|nr:PEP-CTERM sorting domain-containing protein [Massilia sp. IC2-477]MCC2954380.1 PEP-CTERM sorting domain-containing protein [Massilia sp. IC2-477]